MSESEEELKEELFEALDVSSFEDALERIEELKSANSILEDVEQCIESNGGDISEVLDEVERLYQIKDNAIEVVKSALDAINDVGPDLSKFVDDTD